MQMSFPKLVTEWAIFGTCTGDGSAINADIRRDYRRGCKAVEFEPAGRLDLASRDDSDSGA
jgi:hypothetical protein